MAALILVTRLPFNPERGRGGSGNETIPLLHYKYCAPYNLFRVVYVFTTDLLKLVYLGHDGRWQVVRQDGGRFDCLWGNRKLSR